MGRHAKEVGLLGLEENVRVEPCKRRLKTSQDGATIAFPATAVEAAGARHPAVWLQLPCGCSFLYDIESASQLAGTLAQAILDARAGKSQQFVPVS